MKALIKSLLHRLLAEYSIYWIYRCTETDLAPVPAPSANVRPFSAGQAQAIAPGIIREQAGFLGDGADAFIFRDADEVTAICIFWHGERYATRNFWPLKDAEAKLVQVITDPKFRGKGAATTLIRESSEYMLARGFHALYARVWHSNTPSRRAFERAGWKRVALAIELKRTPQSNGIKFFVPTWAALTGKTRS